MKKSLKALLIGAFALGSSVVLAKTGVVVLQTDGTKTFYASEEVVYIEFVEDYTPDEDQNPAGPSTPSDDNGDKPNNGEQAPSDGNDNNSSGSDKPANPENKPGSDNNNGSNGDSDNTGNSGSSSGDNNGGNSGTVTPPADQDKPGEPSNPSNPSNPSDKEDPKDDTNPGETTQPEQPEQPTDPEPSTPEDPGEQEPSETEQPTIQAFQLYTGNSIQLESTYLIVGNGVCAGPVALSNAYGYLPSVAVSVSNNVIKDNLENGYLFTTNCTINGKEYSAPSGKFLIRDHNGRYLYLTGSYTSFNLAETPELNGNNIADGYLFSATKSGTSWILSNTREGNTKFIAYSSSYNNFAAYNSLSKNDSYPTLYILGEVTDDNSGGNSDNGNTGNSGNNGNSSTTDVVPDDFKYPLSYVVLPEGTPQQVKEYTSFTLNFNKENHTPNYVAWELLASETSGSVDRKKYSYWVDKDIDGCLSTDFGYSTYKYERGHMCPAADNKWSAEAMKDCMAMTNMVPQSGSLNGSTWGTLEDKSRTWAQNKGAIWIVAGPLYSSTDNLYVGDAKARVPSACFKAILYYNGANSKAIAFVFQNGSNPGNYQDYAMSIDDLEKLTGFDFFSALPDDIETAVEASYSLSDWN